MTVWPLARQGHARSGRRAALGGVRRGRSVVRGRPRDPGPETVSGAPEICSTRKSCISKYHVLGRPNRARRCGGAGEAACGIAATDPSPKASGAAALPAGLALAAALAVATL
jgi:hypothetical protein